MLVDHELLVGSQAVVAGLVEEFADMGDVLGVFGVG
jgi:hypothetical protein